MLGPSRVFLGPATVERARNDSERVLDALSLGARKPLEQEPARALPLAGDGVGHALAAWGEANVALASVVGVALSDHVAAAFQTGEVAAGRRGVDPQLDGE